MKNAVIFHGIGSSPNDFWFPYVRQELEKKGYKVWVPELPQAEDPDIKIQTPYVLKNWKIDGDTILIGHSSGASLILAILEAIDAPIKQAILVSGFLRRGGERPPKAVKENENDYDWQKIKRNVKNIVFINSANDPWGCDDKEGRLMFERLGGLQIINNDGHMGSTSYNQPYKEFPLLIKLIELQES